MKRFKARQIYLLFILILSGFLITGCGSGGGEVTEHWAPGVTLVSIAVTPATASVPVTGTQQYTATATYSNRSTIDRTTASTWTSANPVNASVGLNTGLATGNVVGTSSVITATFGGMTATATLTVNAATSAKFEVTPIVAVSIPVTGTQQYAAIETFSDGSTFDRTADSTWTAVDLVAVSTTPVATIDNTVGSLTRGKATGVNRGTSTIKAEYGVYTGAAAGTRILTVNAATSTKFEVIPATASMPVTGTQQFTAIETFSDGTSIDRTAVSAWTSPDLTGSGVATISNTSPTIGVATAVKPGTSTITAKYSGQTATAIFTVNGAIPVSFVVTPATASIPVTGTQQYSAFETFSDGSISDRTAASTWSAPDLVGSGVATIGSNTGLATGVTKGTSTITATYVVGAVTKIATAILTVNSGVNLGTAARYGTFGGTAGMTNTGNLTVITGSNGNTADIGTTATGNGDITGFHERAGGAASTVDDSYSDVLGPDSGKVTGRIYTCAPSTTGPTVGTANATSCAIATLARLNAETAYKALAAMPSDGVLAGNLANSTKAPGVWTTASSVLIQGGDLTLDAGGDANAVFVFQIGSTLTVGGPGVAAPQSIILAGGAQAKNVFWQVGTAATINAGAGGTMVGTIIANSGVTFSTAGKTAITTLNGRALSLISSVTMVNTVINVPAP